MGGWYRVLDRLIPGTTKVDALKKMLLDQVSRRRRGSGGVSGAGGGRGLRCSQTFHSSLLGGLCPLFSRLFPPTGRSTQRTVSPGQLGQAAAGELGRCGAASGLWQPGSPRGTRQVSWGRARCESGQSPRLWRRGAEGCGTDFLEQKSVWGVTHGPGGGGGLEVSARVSLFLLCLLRTILMPSSPTIM